jgi:hypothetical protein
MRPAYRPREKMGEPLCLADLHFQRRQGVSARPRGFINDWRPRAETLLLLDQAQAVLDEYRDQLPLTLRQVFIVSSARTVTKRPNSPTSG